MATYKVYTYVQNDQTVGYAYGGLLLELARNISKVTYFYKHHLVSRSLVQTPWTGRVADHTILHIALKIHTKKKNC